MVSPCNCSGTQKYIHIGCLDNWMKVKLERNEEGVENWNTCELCHATFATELPLDIRTDIGTGAWIRYRFLLWKNRVVNSSAFRFLALFDDAVWLYSSLYSVTQLVQAVPRFPKILIAARTNLNALRPMTMNLVSCMLMEVCLSTFNFGRHLVSISFYGFGWMLDAAARHVGDNYVAQLSPSVQPFALGALIVPQVIGFALQAFDLSILYVLGTVSSAWLDGMVQAIAFPLSLVSDMSRFATQRLRKVSGLLARGIHGAAATVFMRK